MNTKIFRIGHISPICLGRYLLHNLWMIVATAMIFHMATSLMLTWFYVPKYQATMTYSINSRTTGFASAGNLTSTREVASVMTELLGTDVMKEGIRNHDPRLANFSGTITATQVIDTNFIVVTATSDTPESAFLSLKALTVVFPELASFISNRNVLNIMRAPSVSSTPSNQVNVESSARTAAILGGIFIVALLCYMNIRSETIQTRTGARRLLDGPILASVSHEKKNHTARSLLRRTNRQVKVFSPTTSFPYVEQINTICTQLEHESAARQRKVFLFTGVGENEGKSTISSNVASALALKGHKVILLDCDLRNPSIHRFFGGNFSAITPLSKLLALPFSADDVEQSIVRHEQTGLHLLTSTHPDLRCTELLSGPTMGPVMEHMRSFDYVIIDSPPMGMFTDAEILADFSDATVLVVRQDYTAACDINDAIDSLNSCKASFLGCVLNDMRISLRSQYGYGSNYGKGSRYAYAGKYIYKGGKKNDSEKSTSEK